MKRLVTLHPESGLTAWRRVALFLVMLTHRLVFLGVAASILHIFYVGVTGRPSRWTKRALLLAVSESAIFAA